MLQPEYFHGCFLFAKLAVPALAPLIHLSTPQTEECLSRPRNLSHGTPDSSQPKASEAWGPGLLPPPRLLWPALKPQGPSQAFSLSTGICQGWSLCEAAPLYMPILPIRDDSIGFNPSDITLPSLLWVLHALLECSLPTLHLLTCVLLGSPSLKTSVSSPGTLTVRLYRKDDIAIQTMKLDSAERESLMVAALFSWGSSSLLRCNSNCLDHPGLFSVCSYVFSMSSCATPSFDMEPL